MKSPRLGLPLTSHKLPFFPFSVICVPDSKLHDANLKKKSFFVFCFLVANKMDLCKNYNITPPKSCRKGSTWKTARNILTWSHFSWRTWWVKDTLANFAVNVDFFTAILKAQASSSAYKVMKILIDTLMQLEILY